MKIQTIKSLNITALFASPINHLLISQAGLLGLFKAGDETKDKRVFVEAPGLKVLIFPNRKKEFAFEGTRILVNDKNEVLPEKSDVTDDFEKIIKSDMVEQNKIIAYGFNYDAVVIPDDNFKNNDLIADKIANIEGIKSAGINVVFEKNNATYVLEIKPIGSGQKFIAHFNAHFNTKEVPTTEELKNKFSIEFLEFQNIVGKI